MDQYLTHYWSFDNEQMFDQIGTAHMTQGNLTTFINDRLGNSKSALALNGGWTQVAPGIYFDTPEFSLSVWVYPLQIGSFSRVIDFGNGQNADNIVFAFGHGGKAQPYLVILSGSSKLIAVISSKNLTMNEWQFLSVTFNRHYARIYSNGQLTADVFLNSSLPMTNRTKCYIGKSNWPNGIDYSFSYLDELKFYNKSLTQWEIVQIMNQNETSMNTFLYFLYYS
jgi:hypothetical protein